MEVRRIAVFASGQGTNFQAIVDAVKAGKLDVEVALLVCDKLYAPVMDRAKEAGVEIFAFRPRDYESREAHDAEIAALLKERKIDLVVLAGYMRLLSPPLTQPFYGRIINIHPSLLPAFPGKDAVKQALRHGVKVTGVTVHFVDDGLDSGPIIAQQAVNVEEDDTAESLLARVHEAEWRLLVQVIGWFREGRVRLDGRKVSVLQRP